MFQKRLPISLLIVIAVLVLFALVGTKPVVKADEEAVKITILMDEYNFIVQGQKPGDPVELKAGQLYDMTLKNAGKLIHEIWWGKDPKMEEGRLDGYSTNLFDGVDMAITGTQGSGKDSFEIDAKGLTEIALNPGQELTIEFTLPDETKGEWEIGCFQAMPKPTPEAAATGTPVLDVPHYAVGMKAKLLVK